jgi:putative transposase
MEITDVYYILRRGKQRVINRYVLAEDFKCKYCGSKNLWLYGKYKGKQLFYCRDCKRKFTGNFALPKMRSPVSQVGDALQSYFSGMSLNEVKQNMEQQYNYSPSVSTIYRWLDRFIKEASYKVRDTKPNVGDTWIADETVIKINRKKYWLFDCIDAKTRFLLASHLSPHRGTREARALMEKATEHADKTPKVVMTDKLAAYLDGIELAFGGDAEHRQGSPFNIKINTNLIERFQGTLKDRTKVLRGLKKPETARRFIEGFLIHYNYFRPHISLKGKTPAEKAGIVLSVNDWLDVVRQPTDTAKIDISTEPRPILRLHHPKPKPLKPPRLGRNEYYANHARASRHYFRGAKKRKIC